MKRRWAGVFLTLFASILPFLTLFTPVAAEANSSNTCIPSSLLGCVNLDVVLNDPDNPNGFPLTGVTVTANRVAPGGGADDSFPLNVDADEARRNIFHSNGTIWGTNDENCDVNPSADRNYFTFTVSGAGVTPVTSPKFNLCYSENNASSTGGLLQRSVTVHWTSGAPATKGGLDGTFSTKDIAGNQRACGGGSNVLLIGSSTTQYSISDNGNNTSSFSSGGFTIEPGTYNVTINCTVASSGTAGVINVTGVVIKANETTHLGNLVCDANVDNCGSNGQNSPLPTSTGGTTTNDTPPDCDAGPGFTWIICGAIHLVVSAVDTIRDSVIVPFLKEPAFDKNDPQFAPAYAIWSSFRNVASVFFILVFFFIVIGTAFGFDNYTIKKVLPHLIAGAILVPFSWYFCALVIDIGNVLGQGVVAVVNAANISTNIDLTSSFDKIFFGGAAVVGGIVLVGAAATVGLGAAITLLLAFATVFLTLILRKILIMLCVVVSPFALLAWVLPNTEKWFREWYRNFFKLVMMYPIIMMLFEAGRIFSATAGATHTAPCTAAGCLQNLIIPIFQITGLVLPLFLVPLAFKWAGKGLALANNAASKFTGSVDKKYGKNSEWAKDRAADAKRNSVNRAKIAEADAKNATGFRKAALEKKAALNWRRAGLHGASDTKKLERSAAYGKAMEEKGTVAAEARQGREGDPEDPRQRLASATQSILNKKSLERGQRQGVLDAYNASGAPSARTLQTQARNATRDSGIEQYGSAAGENARNLLNDRNAIHDPANHVSNAQKFAAANIAGAAKLGDKLGDAKGINAGTAAYEDQLAQQLAGGPGATVTAAHRAAARTMRMNDNTGAKADDTAKSHVTANQTANTKITGEAELDTLEQGKHATGTVTLDQARRMRLQNLAASTDTQVRESLGTQEGEITARNLVTTTAGRETMKTISEAGVLKARDTVAAGRADRSQRVALQNTTEGYRTTSEVLATANTKAGEHMAEGIGADKQLLDQHHADEALASAQGNPNLSPSLNNWVRSGAEKSKASLSAQSTQRMANVSALANGNASTALEETTAGLQAAERNAVIKGQAVKGQAETLNTNLTAEAARLAGGGPITAAHINQAANNIRARSLGSAANPVGAGAVARAQAATDLTNQIGTDVGGGRNLQAEIETEAAALAGGGAVTATHINQARANIQDRHLKSVQQNSEHAGAIKNREERSLAAGTSSGLNAQINEEAAVLAASLGGTPATHLAQARANVQARNLSAAGTAAFDKGAADVRRANETKIGLEQDIDDAIATEAATLAGGAAITGAHLAQARSNVLQRRSDTLGKNVRTQASVKAREEADSNIRGATAIDQVIGNEAQRLIDTGAATGLSAAQITEQARRNIVAAAGTATGLATADKISKDLRSNVGVANDLESEVDARVAQNHGGVMPIGPALTAARDQAAATIRAERVANTGDEAEATAGRTAAKQRGKSKKVANDIQAKITDQVGPGAGAATRAAAAKNIRDKELSDIAEDAGVKGARSFREEAESATGTVNIQDELINKAMAANPALTRNQASQKVFAETQADAGKAARITGEQAATQSISKSRGVISAANAAEKRIQSADTERIRQQEADERIARGEHEAEVAAAIAEAETQNAEKQRAKNEERVKKGKEARPITGLSDTAKQRVRDTATQKFRADAVNNSTANTSLSSDQARSKVIQDTIAAGQELTERQQNQQYGSQAALAEAFNSTGRTTLDERQNTYRQAESKRIVNEEATVNAYQKVTDDRRSRGIAEKSYNERVKDFNSAEYDRLLETQASQAEVSRKIIARNNDGTVMKDSNGNEVLVSLRDAELNDGNIKTLLEVVRNGDDAERIAAIRALTGSQGAFTALNDEFVGPGKLFGGDIYNKVDPEFAPIWDKGARGAKSPDATKSPIAAFTEISPQDFATMGKGGMKRAMEFYVGLQADIERKTSDLGSITDPRERAAAEDVIENLQDLYDKESKNFSEAIIKAATTKTTANRVDPISWDIALDYANRNVVFGSDVRDAINKLRDQNTNPGPTPGPAPGPTPPAGDEDDEDDTV